MVSLDLQDAYLQVPVHPSSRHYRRFCVGDSVLQFCTLLRPFDCPSGVHTGHGPYLFHHAPLWVQDPALPGRLARHRVLVSGDSAGEGLSPLVMSGAQHPRQSLQELSDSLSDFGLSGDEALDASFGVFLTPKHVQKLSSVLHEFVSCRQQPLPLWCRLLWVMSSFLAIVPGSRLRMRSLQLRLSASGRLLPDSASVSWDDSCLVDLRWWSVESHLLVGLPLDLPHQISPCTPTPRIRVGEPFSRTTTCPACGLRRSRAFQSITGNSLRCFTQFRVFFWSFGVVWSPSLRTTQQLCPICVSKGDALLDSELHGSVDSSSLRGPSRSPGSSIHSRSPERPCRLPQSQLPGPRLGVDPLSSSVSGVALSVAGYYRPFRDLLERSPPGVLRSNCESSVSRHGRRDAVVGRSAGVCLPSFRPPASCAVEGQAVQGSGAHSSGSALASAPLVSRPSGASGGCSSVPSTASLPSLPPEPPRASYDCVLYIE